MPIYFDDKQLANRLIAGDEQAFRRFFDENFSRLYRFALVRLGGRQEATAEIVQSALTRALRKIHCYRGEAALFTWLCVICRHEIADWWKRQRQYEQHVVLIEDDPAIRAALESLDAPAEHDPLRSFQQTETARLIQVALDRLPPQYGDALEWKYIEGYSVKEIAARLELSYEAAQSMLARARRLFREVFSTLVQPAFD